MNGTKEFGNPFSLERITLNANSALTAEDLSVAILSQPNKPSAGMRLVLVGQKGVFIDAILQIKITEHTSHRRRKQHWEHWNRSAERVETASD